MSNFKVEFPNLNQVIKKLKTLPGNMEKEFAKTLFSKLSVEVEGRAKAEFVPVAPDGGALRTSIHTTKPKISPGKVSVSVVAGGPATPYAQAVHEAITPFTHPSLPKAWRNLKLGFIVWNVPGTGAKYLELPLNEALPGIKKALDRAVKRATLKRL